MDMGNTVAKIYKNGIFEAFNFDEFSEAAQIKKDGTVKAFEFIEGETIQMGKDGKFRFAEFVEIDGSPVPPVYSFAGLQIASGPLAYKNGAYVIENDWNHDSYDSVYGNNNGSYYFNWDECYNVTVDGWRLPTQAEWASICGTTRAGSSVNGSAGKHYALVKLTGVTHAGSSTPSGLLIFPDGATITGKALSGMDNTTQTTGVTLEELNAYLAQGCAFLPASGLYDYGDWVDGGNGGSYWSSTEDGEYSAYYLFFYDSDLYPDNYGDKSGYYYSVRLVKPVA